MSMNLTVYIGPYLIVPKTFEWYGFDSLVTDGRCEAGTDDAELYLIPNLDVQGISRQLQFDRHSETPVVSIEPVGVGEETMRFRTHVESLIVHCRRHKISVRMEWGVVPCWG